jgi:tetratricopeptide (TPR) repeat protein
MAQGEAPDRAGRVARSGVYPVPTTYRAKGPIMAWNALPLTQATATIFKNDAYKGRFLVAKDPARYTEALKRGLAFNRAERWLDAIREFKIAIGEYANQAVPYAGLGEALFGLKQLERAMECYKLAARYSQGEIVYFRRVADIQERLGQLTEVGRTYMAIGEIYLRRRQLDDAISHWQRAVRLEPNLLGAHQRLAMVFQRQGNLKAAVREYLAIARILQMRGEKQKAMQMCRAALRLDPGNSDVLTAVDLIQRGAEAYRDFEEEEEIEAVVPAQPAGSLADAVRQMANIFESEQQRPQPVPAKAAAGNPVEEARRLAQEQLAEEIFRDEEDEDLLYGAGDNILSKLERDALIGQGIDYQSRGRAGDAITCYERAVAGGLKLPAAYFTLAVLYHEQQRPADARRMLAEAAREPLYRPASQSLATQLK